MLSGTWWIGARWPGGTAAKRLPVTGCRLAGAKAGQYNLALTFRSPLSRG